MNNADADPIQSPSGLANEPTDANPVPLSPTDPAHRTSDGDTPPEGGALEGNFRGVPVPLPNAAGAPALRPLALPADGDLGDMVKERPVGGDAVVRPDSEGQV